MTQRSRVAARGVSDTEALLRLLPEQLPLLVYIYDLIEGRNVYANPRLTDVLGYETDTSSSINGTLLREVIHPDDAWILSEAPRRFATAADGEVITLSYRMRAANGQWRWLRSRDIVMSRLPDGTPHLVLGAAEDITQQREAEEQAQAYLRRIESDQHRLKQLLELNERERRLVAYDVHDGFVQDVVAAQLAIDGMLDRLAKTDPDSIPPLLRARAFVRKSIDEARRVVSELRPSTTDDGGLVEAIQFLVDEAEVGHRLDVKFSYAESFPPLSPLLVRALARIVQEALNNVRRHAQTREANINLSLVDNVVHLEIEDEGVGFNPDEIPPGRYGLEGMRERARVFGGTLALRSRPREGCHVLVTVPVDPPPEGMPPPQPTRAPRPSVKNRRPPDAKARPRKKRS